MLPFSVASGTHWVGVDAPRPEPEIDTLPKKLRVHGDDLSRRCPSHHQLPPCPRVMLVVANRVQTPPYVQVGHVVQEVTEHLGIGYQPLAHRVVGVIDDENGIVHLASSPPLNAHGHDHSLVVWKRPHPEGGTAPSPKPAGGNTPASLEKPLARTRAKGSGKARLSGWVARKRW